MVHNGVIAEFLQGKVGRMLEQGIPGEDVLKAIRDYTPLRTSRLPAFEEFLNSFG